MTADITARRALRTKFMNWAYDKANGSRSEPVDAAEFLTEGVAGDLTTEHDLRAAIEYLEGEQLIEAAWTFAELPTVLLRHDGIVEVEEARTRPDRPTEHFVPIVNITTVHGDVVGSQIQQGSSGASQTGIISVNQRQRVEAFITAARQAAQTPEMDSDDRTKVLADLDFMENELGKEQPRWERLRAVAEGVRAIIVSGLGQALGKGITALPWHDAVNAVI